MSRGIRYYLARAENTGRAHVIYYARQPHEKQRGSRHAIDSVQARHPKARANADAVSAAGPPAPRCCFLGLARSGGRKEKGRLRDDETNTESLELKHCRSVWWDWASRGSALSCAEDVSVGFGIRALAPSVLALQAKHSSVRFSPPEPILPFNILWTRRYTPVFTSCRLIRL